MMRTILSGLILGLALGLASCDDKPSVPQSVLDQAKQAEQQHRGPKIPTTQELLSGPRTRLALLPLPLTMEVPPGWGKLGDNNPAGIKVSTAGLNLIQGYAPSGEVQIRISSRPTMKQDELDQILSYGKKEMAGKPNQILKFELRPVGSVKILERQSLGQPGQLTTYDSNNQPHTKMETPFNWTLSVLVPQEGNAYQVYELSFVVLTKDQYDQDKDFLNSILSTLHYAGDRDSGVHSTPATQP